MNTAERTLVLVNPAAGGGRPLRIRSQISAFLGQQGLEAEFVEPGTPEELEQRAAEGAAAGYSPIVTLGGDGTFQRVVKATLGMEVVLGYLPAGGGNDIAQALGIPRDPVAAAHVLIDCPARRMDVLRARFASGHTAVYLGGGGLGLDTEAAALANGTLRHLPGAARYVAAALKALARFQPFQLTAEIDDQRVDAGGPVLIAAVTNTPGYGAGVRIAPEAKIDDGLLDLVILSALPWTRIVELIPVLLRTGDVRGPEIRRFRGRRVTLCADRPLHFHGDGEMLGEAPVDIENLPSAIQVLAPPRG